MRCPAFVLAIIATFTPYRTQHMAGANRQRPLIHSDHARSVRSSSCKRTSFGMISCSVSGWPSIGGIVQKSVTGVELEWLGLSRSEISSRSSNTTAEDDFCVRLLRLGARWWRSEAFHDEIFLKSISGYPCPYHLPPDVYIGYPSTGGIWSLRIPSTNSSPSDFARVVMAFSMDERCAVLEQMGATFYGTVEDCPDMSKSLEDGKEIGKQWEKRMEELDNSEL